MALKYLLTLLFVFPSVVLCKDYFTAAVFEHRPRGINETGKQEIVENLKFYEKAATVAAEKGADIILFNEFGLFEYKKDRAVIRNFMEHVPDPQKGNFNPCIDKKDNLILPALSCMARKHKMYVVANMGDVQHCDEFCDASEVKGCKAKCPIDQVLMYNTDVAFDREGNLIARYHKMHPYFENLNVPEDPEFVTFKTDVGTFGVIVCFDSLFKESMILARHYDIDTLLFPTFWFDDIVPLNGIEWQQSWALANKVNFVSANTQTPGNGSLGSGIFSPYSGALVYTYEPDGESKLLVANVPRRKSDVQINPSITVIKLDSVSPKIETGDAFPKQGYSLAAGPVEDHFLDYRYYKHQTENYTLVKLEKESATLESCNNGFCCKLNYEAIDMKEDFYLGAFSGLNNVRGYYHWCEETCLLLRCDPFDGKPCVMQPSNSNTVFKKVQMAATFTSERVYPTVSKTKFRLAPKNEWKYERKGYDATLSFKTKATDPLLKAALMGRCYDQDPEFIPWYKY